LDLALLAQDIGSRNEELAKQLEYEKSLRSLEDQKTKLECDISLTTAIKELEEEETKLTAAVGEDPEIKNLKCAKLLVSQKCKPRSYLIAQGEKLRETPTGFSIIYSLNSQKGNHHRGRLSEDQKLILSASGR
jgi:hypothetical protein